jgi:hypothetical protein
MVEIILNGELRACERLYAGATLTLLGDSDRARCHSWFHKVLAGLRATSTEET